MKDYHFRLRAFIMSLLISLVFLTGCNTSNPEELLKSFGVKYEQIVYLEQSKEAIIVIYRDTYKTGPGIGVAAFDMSNSKPRIILSGSRSYTETDPIVWDIQSSNKGIKDKPFRIIYGFINDSKVENVSITEDNVTANIPSLINSGWKKVWLKQIDSSSRNIELSGFSKDHEEIFHTYIN